jgi:thymidine kinase
LIIIGGDREKTDPREPNYCTRCDSHHFLPGKEYSFLILKPLGEEAARGDLRPLKEELGHLAESSKKSRLHRHMEERYAKDPHGELTLRALRVPCIAEKALIYLYAEQNLITSEQIKTLIRDLQLDDDYIHKRLQDNHRSLV